MLNCPLTNFLLLFFLLGCIYNCLAQEHLLTHYTVEDGLPSSHVYHALQDSKGYMWFCTDKGVARFDGYEFEIFTVKDGLPSNDVWKTYEDDKGKIWFDTFNAIVYFDSIFHIVPNNTGRDIDMIRGQVFLPDGTHYIYTGRIFIEQNTKITLLEGVHTIYFDIAAKKIDSYSTQEANFFSHYPTGGVHIKDRIKPHLLLIKGNGGSCLIDENSGKITQCFGDVTKINQALYFIQKKPPAEIVDSNFLPIKKYDFLKDYEIQNVYEDRSGNWWLSTLNGLYLWTAAAQSSTSYPRKKSKIIALTKANGHHVFAGTEDGVLMLFTQGNKINRVQLFQERIDRKMIRGLAFFEKELFTTGPFGCKLNERNSPIYKAGSFSINGTEVYFKGDTVYQFSSFDPKQIYYSKLSGKSINTGTNSLLVASSYAASRLLPNDTLYDTKYIDNQRTYAIAENSKNKIWLGRKSGLFLLHKGSTIGFTKKLLQSPINDLKVDDTDKLWVATDGFGLFRYHEGKIKVIKELDGQIINHLHLEQNEIYASTNQGIAKIRLEGEQPFRYTFQKITTAHGLASSEVFQTVVDSNLIYAATQEGLSIIQGDKINSKQEKPRLHIRTIAVNGEKRPVSAHYNLPYFENNINIDYVCLSYKSAGKIRYEYQMTGIDTAWQSTMTLRREYPLLPYGDYQFDLRAIDIDGFVTATQSLSFHIRAPWWKLLWVRALFGIGIGLLVSFFVQGKIKAIRQKAAEENRINKKIAELELTALQAQMNPHFVFNALHAIQDFVFQKEERVANRYLVKFSRLMRLFLESSKEKTILLADEINMLQLYIDLEQLRFEDKFDLDFTVDPQIETAMQAIPSMLLQPYVENAINHGLNFRKTKGLLSISIQERDNLLHCTIADNGIGRAKAKELRQKSYKSHKSRGMAIVEERRRVMSLLNDSPIQIEIEDLTDENGVGTGTKVNITFPINQ